MRAYRFALLDKKEFDTTEPPKGFYSGKKIVLEQNMDRSKTFDNIHIEFDIQQLVDNEEKEVFDTATIFLYNVNRYWHNENAQKIINNAKIVLYAGTKASPIHYHQGLIDYKEGSCYAFTDADITLRPIYQGYVKNAYPDMDGINTVLKLNLANESFNEEITGLVQFNIKNGEEWRPSVKKFLEEIIKKEGLSLTTEIGEPSKGSLERAKCNTNPININGIFRPSSKNGVSLAAYVKKAFNEIIYKDGNVIYIGQNKNIVNKPPVVIRDKNLIGQPQMTGLKTISFSVPMTSKFRVLQKIKLELESFVSINQMFYGEGDLGYNPLNRADKMFKGEYQIIQIWHKGQSRNPNAESWCTTIEAVEI
ncbi:hypothetical protein [Brachyspira pilosicoli]